MVLPWDFCCDSGSMAMKALPFLPWCFAGTPMELARCSQGTVMVLPWYFHGALLVIKHVTSGHLPRLGLYREIKNLRAFFNLEKEVIMLGLELTHTMLRSGRSTHQAIATNMLPWRFNGTCMVLPWEVRGAFSASIMFPWEFHGASMGRSWRFHGASMRLGWYLHGNFMVFQWYIYGGSMVVYALPLLPWCCKGPLMVFPWNFHGDSMVLAWEFLGASMQSSSYFLSVCAFIASMMLPWGFDGASKVVHALPLLPWDFCDSSMVFAVLPCCFHGGVCSSIASMMLQ